MNHDLIVAGEALTPPAGLNLTNFNDPNVSTFDQRRRHKPVTELVLHESVTRSISSTAAVLKRRKLGVHLMVGPDGAVTQHADLAHASLAHAKGHNFLSVGLEVVNPYYPSKLKPNSPWRRTIEDAPWAHKGSYVVPTPEQAESTCKLIDWLTGPHAQGLNIPRRWVGLKDGDMHLGRVASADDEHEGILAHQYFGHADAAWPVFYAWLRLEAGLPPCHAYEEAIRRATGVRRQADVSDLISKHH